MFLLLHPKYFVSPYAYIPAESFYNSRAINYYEAFTPEENTFYDRYGVRY